MDLNLVLQGMANNFYKTLGHTTSPPIKNDSMKDSIEDDLKKIREASLYPTVPFAMDFKPYLSSSLEALYSDPKFHKPYLQIPAPHLSHQAPLSQPPTPSESPAPPTPTPHHKSEKKLGRPQKVAIPPSQTEFPHCKRKPLPLEQCPICKKYFRRMTTHLQKHADFQQHMGPNETLGCRLCTKVFSNVGNLQIHMRTHTGAKPYVCEICAKGFAQSCNLQNHMRTHTGERPFKCPYCERAFSQSGNLSNHIRLHLDQKPFKCHFCDRAFTQSGNLNSHIRNNHKNENHDSF